MFGLLIEDNQVQFELLVLVIHFLVKLFHALFEMTMKWKF